MRKRVKCFSRWAANRIDRLPGDEHSHDGDFACAGGQFEGKSLNLRIHTPVGTCQMLKNTFASNRMRSHPGQPDSCFEDKLAFVIGWLLTAEILGSGT